MRKIEWSRFWFIGFAGACAALAAIYGQPIIHNNQDVINTVVTIFAVLAGFQMALIALLGDPGFLSSLSSHGLEKKRINFRARINRQIYLFLGYLATLAIALLAVVFKNVCADFAIWLERGFIAFGVVAFIVSFTLPWSFLALQMHRYDELVEARQREEAALAAQAAKQRRQDRESASLEDRFKGE